MKHTREIYASSQGEHNDCAVRALSVAAGLPYESAHALLKKHGRVDNRGTYPSSITKALIDLAPESTFTHGDRRLTLGTFTKLMPMGTFIVFVRGHVLSVVDGTVHDWKEAPRRRVKFFWKLIPSETLTCQGVMSDKTGKAENKSEQSQG
jgi:hypothetical protein